MAHAAERQSPETRYTVFIRVPIPRGDFVDPPTVHWDSSKDRALWKVLSSASKGTEIDWPALANQFDVSLPFLLQQAAWLYERQLSQVREQLRKVNRPTSSGASPTPPSITGSAMAGGQPMRRGGSGGSRVPSSLSFRARDSPMLKGEEGVPGTPVQTKAPPISRTSSTNTVYRAQKRNSNTQLGRESSPKPSRLSLEAERSIPQPAPDSKRHSQDVRRRSQSPPVALDSSSSSSSSSAPDDHPAPLSRSRAFPRRPRFSAQKPGIHQSILSSADEDEEDDTPSFLPSSSSRNTDGPPMTPDPSATLRLPYQRAQTVPTTQRRPPSATATPKPPSPSPAHPPSSSSPTSSSTSQPPTRPAAILSPRQRQLAKEGSEGSPSMGSSFSDLDDASVTQSALEEALVREMGAGGSSIGVAGRMSLVGVGKALKNRYL